MNQRLDLFQHVPEAVKGFVAAREYVHAALPADLLELINLHISLINGCADCIHLHSQALLKLGVPPHKVALVSVWDEVEAMFSAKERAALAWAGVVTRIPQATVPDAAYQQALTVLTEQEMADITVAVALINTFNRIGTGMRVPPVIR